MDDYNADAKAEKEKRAEKNSISALKNRIEKNEQMLRELANIKRRDAAKSANPSPGAARNTASFSEKMLSRSVEKVKQEFSADEDAAELDEAAQNRKGTENKNAPPSPKYSNDRYTKRRKYATIKVTEQEFRQIQATRMSQYTTYHMEMKE